MTAPATSPVHPSAAYKVVFLDTENLSTTLVIGFCGIVQQLAERSIDFKSNCMCGARSHVAFMGIVQLCW